MDDKKAKIKQYIEEILNNVKQMVISTSSDNKPWSSTIFFAFDKSLNIYFFSREDRRHSKEILKNPNVSGAIAREHKEGLGEPSRGLQFEGECRLIEPENASDAYEIYRKRFPQIVKFHSIEKATQQLYKIKVKKFVLFDTLNFPDISRQELEL